MSLQSNTLVTALIFSKDRPMQLCAAIESFLLHCKDSNNVRLFVLYKPSGDPFAAQYAILQSRFPGVSFLLQSDFKTQLLDVVRNCTYILFLVDDNIFVADFTIADPVAALAANPDALGFSLRLGANTTYCYSRDRNQQLPAFSFAAPNIMEFDWTTAQYDFGYPLELSSSLYRSTDLLPLLQQLDFDNPNILEDRLAANASLFAQTKPALLCCERSVAFCNPINKVQSVFSNRSALDGACSPRKLAELFDRNLLIDVRKYSGFVPNACHHEVKLQFTSRLDVTPAPTQLARAPANAAQHVLPQAKPRFSVIMANYNTARYISQAIDSVLRQTFQDWELIIVDDGSTDNSVEVVTPYLCDPRIRLLRHQSNLGYTAALKTAIAHVRSEYFGILDSDDCLAPHALETMFDWHLKLADHGLIYSQFMFCSEDLSPRKLGFCAQIPPDKTTLDENLVSHFKTFKLRDYLKTPGYDENILYAEDVDIVYKMEEVTKLKFVNQCLYFHRELPHSISRTANKVNVAVMSRVKARINALKRRSAARANSAPQIFAPLFKQVVADALAKHQDVRQYFAILQQLYEKGRFNHLPLPPDIQSASLDDALLWLAANVDVDFDRLFNRRPAHPSSAGEPLVSVYMVAYNAERFIRQAIDSVLAQSYNDFELLMIDDGSTDNTPDLIASYSDPRIRYIRQDHKNFASGMNRAISQAKGEFVLGVDSDDFVTPDYLEKMIAFAVQHPHIDYFYPRRLVLVDEAGQLTSKAWDYNDFPDNRVLPAFLLANAFGPVPNPGSLKRKSLFGKTGPYDEVETVEDFAFLCRNALKIKFKRIDDHADYFYRLRPLGNSHRFEARDRIMAEALSAMISIYPPELLYPQLSNIDDPALRTKRFYDYLMMTFYKHSHNPRVRFGLHYRRFADHYRQKLIQAIHLHTPADHFVPLSDETLIIPHSPVY